MSSPHKLSQYMHQELLANSGWAVVPQKYLKLQIKYFMNKFNSNQVSLLFLQSLSSNSQKTTKTSLFDNSLWKIL